MKIYADLHIHSKYSYAVSPAMELENIASRAALKGINVIATGDFTCPRWFSEIEDQLVESEPGLFRLKDNKTSPTRFMLSAETGHVYTQDGRGRRVHLLIYAPGLTAVRKINRQLAKRGNLAANGRPILKVSARELVEIALDADPDCLVVPAHAWTPWYSVFGSKSGFDSLEECFGDMTPQIRAIETGLSSDPAMNWQVSALDNIALISNSDAHSPANIGREANIFECELSYDGIISAIKNKNPQQFLGTIEFFPQKGKYHFDGHRACDVSCSPEESAAQQNICPGCNRKLTIGVLNRVQALADRSCGITPKGAIPFKNLVPLAEIIATVRQTGIQSKRVNRIYQDLINSFPSEFSILLEAPYAEIASVCDEDIAQAICAIREDRVRVIPGFDGRYGEIILS